MHQAAMDFVQRCIRFHGPWRDVVEVGGRNLNGSVRPLFWKSRYTAIDLEDGEGVDVVGDALDWWPDTPPDCVLCLEVLEHVEHAWRLTTHMARWLRPGGVLIVTCASPDREPHSGIDGGTVRDGEWYKGLTFGQLLWGDLVDMELVEMSTPATDTHAMWRAV